MQRGQDSVGAMTPPPSLPTAPADGDPQNTTPATEDMDSSEPAPASQQSSANDRGKRAAGSPALSPKTPLYKKQNWETPDRALQDTAEQEHLAAHPASDQPTSEQSLKLMLLSLQKDLRTSSAYRYPQYALDWSK